MYENYSILETLYSGQDVVAAFLLTF